MTDNNSKAAVGVTKELTGLASLQHRVRSMVVDIIRVVAPDADLTIVQDEVRLRDQLDMDSMDFLDIVMELRKRYKVEVPKEDYPRLATLKGCVEYLLPKLQAVAAI